MVTAGLDGKVKVWDLRTYKELDSYDLTPASALDVSQLGLVATSHNGTTKVWKGLFEGKHQDNPYMEHKLPGALIQDMHFCPFDDVLGIGHSDGFSSVIVPGSGEPNFDTFEANPYQNKKQRQESEVKQLLEKVRAIPPNASLTSPKARTGDHHPEPGLCRHCGRDLQEGVGQGGGGGQEEQDVQGQEHQEGEERIEAGAAEVEEELGPKEGINQGGCHQEGGHKGNHPNQGVEGALEGVEGTQEARRGEANGRGAREVQEEEEGVKETPAETIPLLMRRGGHGSHGIRQPIPRGKKLFRSKFCEKTRSLFFFG